MRRYQLSRTLFFYVLISLFTAPLVSQKPEPHFSVVTLLVEFPDGYESLGTGTFVDHDGLILTADHVVHNTTVKSSSIAQGPIPPQIQPSKITIYNKRLGFQWTVDLSQADSVVGGAISSTRWVDLALVRVKLSDTERLVVQPLAISIDLPVQGSPLSAWGPACKDPKDPACLKVNTIPANLDSDPTGSEYESRLNGVPGYSGGPLLNANGMIIGIASYGDVLAGAEIIRQRYIPARFIHDLFTSRIPPSTNITAQTACKKINELTYLTTFDLREMFPPQSQSTTSQEVCNCCCDALQKTSANAYSPPPMEHCAPALFCSRHTLALAMNKLKLALMNNNAGPETESAYLGVRRQFVSLDVGLLPVPERIELLDAFASTGTLVATYKQNVSADVAGTAAKDALTAYKNRVALGETPETYFQLGKTLQLTGDKSKSDAANALAYIITDTPSDRADLKSAEKELRKKALKDIPSKFEDVKQ